MKQTILKVNFAHFLLEDPEIFKTLKRIINSALIHCILCQTLKAGLNRFKSSLLRPPREKGGKKGCDRYHTTLTFLHFLLVIYVYSGGLDGCWLVVFIGCPFPYLWFETRAVPWRPCPENLSLESATESQYI